MTLYSSSGQKTFAGEIFHMGILTWVGASSVSILVFLFANLGVLNPITDWLQRITLEPRSDIYQASVSVENLFNSMSNFSEVAKENQDLSKRVTELESRLAEVEVVFNENERLINESGIQYSRNYKNVGAKVIGYDERQTGIITINKGSAAGIKENDIAVVEKIAIGQVIELSDHSAKVLLINSPDSTIPVKTQLLSLGLLTGGNAGQLLVEEILQSTDIQIGQKVYTTGVNDNFPPDLYVGEVKEILADPRDSTKKVVLENPVNLDKLTLIKILTLE